MTISSVSPAATQAAAIPAKPGDGTADADDATGSSKVPTAAADAGDKAAGASTAAKTVVDETITIADGVMTTIITYSDGTTKTTQTKSDDTSRTLSVLA